jgi:hypothetical protein
MYPRISERTVHHQDYSHLLRRLRHNLPAFKEYYERFTIIDHSKRDGGMYILPERIAAEIVLKTRLSPFEEQTEYIKLFSYYS